MNNLDVRTLEFVKDELEKFANKEWKDEQLQRYDAIIDFAKIINALINDEAEKQRIEFNKTILNVKESMKIAQSHCVGCTIMKHEGPRSYSDIAPLGSDGHCSICGKARYERNTA